MAAGDATSAAQSVERSRSSTLARAPPPGAQTDLGHGTGAGSAGGGLARRHLARGHSRAAHLALRRRPRQAGAPRLLALRPAARGMVPHRMARGRERADQILALDLAAGDTLGRPRRPGQAQMAYRTRLPGAQAGDRPRSLRGARLARLPPPRHARHRRLRIPGLRVESDFPLSLAYPRVTDPAAPPLRPERHVANSIATIRIRLARALVRRLPRCPCCQRPL